MSGTSSLLCHNDLHNYLTRWIDEAVTKPGVEIEGKLTGSEVREFYWEQWRSAMESNCNKSNSSHWQKTCDDEVTRVYYLDDNENFKNVRVIKFADGQCIFEQKHSIATLDGEIPEQKLKQNNCFFHGIRLTFKLEQRIESNPPLEQSHLVRMRRRWRYIYQSRFAYDFTVVWQGANEELARVSKPRFEIEIELLSHTHPSGSSYLANSMLLKLYDLATLPNTSVIGQLLQQPPPTLLLS